MIEVQFKDKKKLFTTELEALNYIDNHMNIKIDRMLLWLDMRYLEINEVKQLNSICKIKRLNK